MVMYTAPHLHMHVAKHESERALQRAAHSVGGTQSHTGAGHSVQYPVWRLVSNECMYTHACAHILVRVLGSQQTPAYTYISSMNSAVLHPNTIAWFYLALWSFGWTITYCRHVRGLVTELPLAGIAW